MRRDEWAIYLYILCVIERFPISLKIHASVEKEVSNLDGHIVFKMIFQNVVTVYNLKTPSAGEIDERGSNVGS